MERGSSCGACPMASFSRCPLSTRKTHLHLMLSQARSSPIPSLQRFLLGSPLSIPMSHDSLENLTTSWAYLIPHLSPYLALHLSVTAVLHTVLSSLQKPSPKTSSHFPPSPGFWLLPLKSLSDLPPLFLRSSPSGPFSTFLWD